jgi:hypothetical protein
MASTDVKVPINELSQRMTLNVTATGMRWWNLRMRAATWLIHIAGVVAPIHFDMDVSGDFDHFDRAGHDRGARRLK